MSVLPKRGSVPSPQLISNEPPWRSRPPSERQLSYLASLCRNRETDRLGSTEGRTAGEISDAIEWAKKQPLRATLAAVVSDGDPSADMGRTTFAERQRQHAEIMEAEYPELVKPELPGEGYWMTPAGDRVFKVQENLNGSGLYAKILDGEQWKYLSGGRITMSTLGVVPLTEARASQYGQLYGQCMICGRKLTDEESIARGIGPICLSNMGW